VLLSGESVLLAQQAPPPTPATPGAADASPVVIPPERLDSLVAPIALYPDPLLAQTLIASTYPLEIIQLKQWLEKNKGLKDKALADAVAKQPWDPAIQSMAAVPDVVKRLADDIQWTTELGNAFLGQQTDVMDAVQRMRQKAQGTGALKSNEQQKVETKVIETQTIIIVEPANPEVVYVPSYSPVVVYGPAYYPYPPIYYPPPPLPGAAFVSFSVGVMVGAAVWGGACCNTHWGHGGGNDVTINRNNTFVNQSQARGTVNASSSSSNSWQHNSDHRGGTPYPGGKPPSGSIGGAGGSGAGNRPASGAGGAGGVGGAGGAGGGQQPGGRPPSGAGGGAGGSGGGNRPAGGASAGQLPAERPSSGGAGGSGASNRPSGGASASQQPAGRPPSSSAGGSGASSRPSGGASASQQPASRSPSSGGGSSSGGFSGGSSGYSGSSAKASSSRGASSMSSSGGASRSGGGGGGSRGGGGGGRR